MLSFLIDECLTPILAGRAHRRGHDAAHVNWRGLDGRRDQAIAAHAMAENCIFVTNNGADFRPIYRAFDIHPGLVVILPAVTKRAQRRLFDKVIEALEREPDTINKLIEVDVEGVVTIRDYPGFQNTI